MTCGYKKMSIAPARNVCMYHILVEFESFLEIIPENESILRGFFS
jgi:hypothetical protein